MNDAPLVELSELRFGYPNGRFRIEVDSLRLARGERVACIGPSGSGKTTLAHLIAGILEPESGRIRVADVDVEQLSDAARRRMRIERIGMVFQQFELLDYLPAIDNVLLPYHVAAHLPLTAEVRARAEALVASMGIAHGSKRLPRHLSQGERQRVAICRALVSEPELVICDEPTGNLDPATAGATLDLLFEQAESRGATLFVVTHDHGLLERFDRVVDMARLSGAVPA